MIWSGLVYVIEGLLQLSRSLILVVLFYYYPGVLMAICGFTDFTTDTAPKHTLCHIVHSARDTERDSLKPHFSCKSIMIVRQTIDYIMTDVQDGMT